MASKLEAIGNDQPETAPGPSLAPTMLLGGCMAVGLSLVASSVLPTLAGDVPAWVGRVLDAAVAGMVIAPVVVMLSLTRHRRAYTDRLSEGEHSPGRLRLAYITGFLLVGLLVVVRQQVIQQHVTRYVDGSNEITLAGRQRVMSQELAQEIADLASEQDDDERLLLSRMIENDLRTWDSAAGALSMSASARAALGPEGGVLRDWLARAEQLRMPLCSTAGEVAMLARSGADAGSLVTYRRAYLEAQDAFDEAMDRATDALTDCVLADLGRMSANTRVLAVVMLAFLGLIAVGVMEPSVRRASRSHRALRQQADRLSILAMIAERTTNLVLVTDRSHRIVWINEGFSRLTGFTLAEASGRPACDFMVSGPTDSEAASRLRDHVERGEGCRVELVFPCKDGRRLTVSLDVQPIRSETGEVTGFMKVGADISEQVGALRRLSESEGRFRELADAAPVMIWLTGPDKGCTDLNRSWLEFTGRTLDAQKSDGWKTSVHPDDVARVYREYSAAFDARCSFELEYRLRRHDGVYRWVTIRGRPRYSGAGEFLGYVGSGMDVTERVRAERMQHGAMMLASRLAAAGNARDAVRAVNDTIAEVTGISRTAVLLFDDDRVCRFVGWRGISESYRRAVEGHCPWGKHATKASPIVAEDVETDESLAGFRDLFRAERIRSLAFVPIMTQQGVVGKLMLYSDVPRGITCDSIESTEVIAQHLGLAVERLVAQERVAASELRHRSIIDTTLDAVISLDAGGAVTEWNREAERTFGWTRDEALGRQLTELIVPEELREAHRAGLRGAAMGGPTRLPGRRIELPAVRRDGGRITVELSIARMHSDAGFSFSAFIRDVTEKKRTDEALRQAKEQAEAANQAKSEFLANMSHEIRTPMSAILGFTDILREDGDMAMAPSRRIECIDTIRRNGEHLLAILNDILDMSKIEAGRMSLERTEVDPASSVRDVIELMRVKTSGKRLALRAELVTPVPRRVTTDPTRVKQILMNLVGNAVKFTEAGEVVVRVSCVEEGTGGATMRFEVSDTGPGIAPEHIPRLFGAFEQGDTSTTRRYGGTGLGLRISQRLARMLGGDLSVTSELGKGSTFCATIRVSQTRGVGVYEPGPLPEPDGRCADLSGAGNQPMLAGVKILLAEDGEDNRRIIMFHLSRAGARVTPVVNGRLAFDAVTAKGADYDLLLTDMQMPEMDGYMLAATLRERGLRIPIIALTAHAMQGDRDKCLNAGCDDYASKPISKAELLGVCRRVLDGGVRRRAA